MCDTHAWKIRSLFIRENLILSSEKMLRKDYGRKGSATKKNSGHEPLAAWSQDELIGSKSTVVT
jgi:hypothetical protein